VRALKRTLALLLLLGACLPMPAAEAEPKREVLDEFCGYENVYCLFVERRNQRLRLTMVGVAVAERVPYRLCVKPPRRRVECKSFVLRKERGVYVGAIGFKRNFFHRQAGRYTVSWRLEGEQLGKALHFDFEP
jgi:hypothetical protein